MKGPIYVLGRWPVSTVTKVNWADVQEVVLTSVVLGYLMVLVWPFLSYLTVHNFFLVLVAGMGMLALFFLATFINLFWLKWGCRE